MLKIQITLLNEINNLKIITVLLYSSNGKKCKEHLKVAVVISSEIYCFTNSCLIYKLTIFIQNCNTCSMQIDTLSFDISLSYFAVQICRPISHAVMKQLKKLKPGIKPKRATARENWKKLQNVRHKFSPVHLQCL